MSQDGIDINVFQGGPHHNEVWTVEQLLNAKQLESAENVAGWITDYAWTKDTITGSESGREARVWRYIED